MDGWLGWFRLIALPRAIYYAYSRIIFDPKWYACWKWPAKALLTGCAEVFWGLFYKPRVGHQRCVLPLSCSSKALVELCLIVTYRRHFAAVPMSSQEAGLSLWPWPTKCPSPLFLPKSDSSCFWLPTKERGYRCHSTRGQFSEVAV